MSIPFGDWSKDRLAGVGLTSPKANWVSTTRWDSELGEVRFSEITQSWVARVYIGSIEKRIVAKIKGEFDSAAVAMGVVERVWKREEEKRNGNGH